MSNEQKTPLAKYVADHIVSWMLELLVLGVIAYFTIAETRKTAQQTRDMLARYDAAISMYAKDKSEVVDAAASATVSQLKQKADGVTKENVIDVLESLKKSKAVK